MRRYARYAAGRRALVLQLSVVVVTVLGPNDPRAVDRSGAYLYPGIRVELAEWTLLAHYDVLRSRLGHDYGSGQRGAELRRRRLRLQARGIDPPSYAATLDRAELERAYQRIGAPRLRRVELETYRAHTPSSERTLKAWSAMRAKYGPGR